MDLSGREVVGRGEVTPGGAVEVTLTYWRGERHLGLQSDPDSPLSVAEGQVECHCRIEYRCECAVNKYANVPLLIRGVGVAIIGRGFLFLP